MPHTPETCLETVDGSATTPPGVPEATPGSAPTVPASSRWCVTAPSGCHRRLPIDSVLRSGTEAFWRRATVGAPTEVAVRGAAVRTEMLLRSSAGTPPHCPRLPAVGTGGASAVASPFSVSTFTPTLGWVWVLVAMLPGGATGVVRSSATTATRTASTEEEFRTRSA